MHDLRGSLALVRSQQQAMADISKLQQNHRGTFAFSSASQNTSRSNEEAAGSASVSFATNENVPDNSIPK